MHKVGKEISVEQGSGDQETDSVSETNPNGPAQAKADSNGFAHYAALSTAYLCLGDNDGTGEYAGDK